MTESEQDALLDKIESRRRWRSTSARAFVVILGAIAAAIATALVLAR